MCARVCVRVCVCAPHWFLHMYVTEIHFFSTLFLTNAEVKKSDCACVRVRVCVCVCAFACACACATIVFARVYAIDNRNTHICNTHTCNYYY